MKRLLCCTWVLDVHVVSWQLRTAFRPNHRNLLAYHVLLFWGETAYKSMCSAGPVFSFSRTFQVGSEPCSILNYWSRFFTCCYRMIHRYHFHGFIATDYSSCILCILDFVCSLVTCSAQWHVRTWWGSSWNCPLVFLWLFWEKYILCINYSTMLGPKTHEAEPLAKLQPCRVEQSRHNQRTIR